MAVVILSGVGAFLAMEFVAAFAHQYLMHGPLWVLHADHHKPHPDKFLQKNDFFFLIFAIPSWLSIQFGLSGGIGPLVGIGFGIAAYGLGYVMVHEIFIHRRVHLQLGWKSPYFRAVQRAHRVHHQRAQKTGCQNFGMLLVPKRYFVSDEVG
jgi:beta-carotene 3-hydroxylase